MHNKHTQSSAGGRRTCLWRRLRGNLCKGRRIVWRCGRCGFMPARLRQVQWLCVLAGEPNDQVPQVQTPSFQPKQESERSTLLLNFFFYCLLIFCCAVVLCCVCRCSGTSLWRRNCQHFSRVKSTAVYTCTRQDEKKIQMAGTSAMCTIHQGGARLSGRPQRSWAALFFKYASTDFPGRSANTWYCVSCLLSPCLLSSCENYWWLGFANCFNNLQIPTVNNLNNLQIPTVKIRVWCAGIGETDPD